MDEHGIICLEAEAKPALLGFVLQTHCGSTEVNCGGRGQHQNIFNIMATWEYSSIYWGAGGTWQKCVGQEEVNETQLECCKLNTSGSIMKCSTLNVPCINLNRVVSSKLRTAVSLLPEVMISNIRFCVSALMTLQTKNAHHSTNVWLKRATIADTNFS